VRTPLAVSLLVAICVAAPAAARAASVEVREGVLLYRAAAGDGFVHSVSALPDRYWIRGNGGRITPGPGCRPDGQDYSCDRDAVRSVEFTDSDDRHSLGVFTDVPTTVQAAGGNDFLMVDLRAGGTADGGAGDDEFFEPRGTHVTLSGGEGVDTISFGGRAYEAVAVRVSLDDVANDGRRGELNDYRSENLSGTRADDVLSGNAGANRLNGGLGSDELSGGAGPDSLDAIDFTESNHPPPFWILTPMADRVSCGAGTDEVVYDEADTVARDCEIRTRVVRGVRLGEASASVRGTRRGDELSSTAYRDKIRGYGGDDVIGVGPAEGRVGLGTDPDLNYDLNGGADSIDPGPGRDVVDARDGNDRVYARDGDRDRIRCGPGRDVVVADRRDAIARDCERVLR
jgi:Ca2+-binding RTX toxin-like protein